MNEDQSSPIAEGQNPAADDSMSESDLIASFMETEPDEQDTTEEEAETESEETEEESPEETEEESEDEDTEEPEEEEEAESAVDIDLEALSQEQLDALAKKLRSKALSRYGKLTGELKDLKREIAGLRTQPAADPLASQTKVTDSRIAAVKDIKGLTEWREQSLEVEEWSQNILDQYGAADPEDVIHTAKDGKEFTKRQLLGIRNDARRLMKTEIPARLKEIQEVEFFQAKEKEVEASLPDQIPALKDEKSTVSKLRKDLMETPVLIEAMARYPALRVWAAAVTPHAANSISLFRAKGAKSKETPATAEVKKKASPPPTPKGVAASGARPAAGKKVGTVERSRSFEATGSLEDLVGLLAAEES